MQQSKANQYTVRTCPLCGSDAHFFHTAFNRDYWECPMCCGVFLSPDQLLPPEMEYQEYCTHHNDVNDTGYQKFVMPLVDLITSNHYVKQIGLDFGAGSGPVVTKMLEDRGFTLQVYDPFFHPDTTVLDNTYDFIVTCEVVEHFYHPRETFNQLMKMLKPNGVLYCKTELFTDAIDFTQWRYPREATHVFFYRPQTVHWMTSSLNGVSATIYSNKIFSLQKSHLTPSVG
jgi:hypothetical protein